MMNIFLEYKEVWVRPKPKGTRKGQAKFGVEGRPIRQKLRRLTPELQQEMNKQVEALLEAGILQPSQSAWISAPVLASKQDDDWTVC